MAVRRTRQRCGSYLMLSLDDFNALPETHRTALATWCFDHGRFNAVAGSAAELLDRPYLMNVDVQTLYDFLRAAGLREMRLADQQIDFLFRGRLEIKLVEDKRILDVLWGVVKEVLNATCARS